MDFTRTLRAGERYVGGWRGGPELIAGLLAAGLRLRRAGWSAPFFVFAVSGLVSIGAMGCQRLGAPAAVSAMYVATGD